MADLFADWTRRLRASDSAALDDVMGVLHTPLLRYAAHLTGDRDSAYDVLQEAFIKLWQVRETLDPALSLRAFLYRIVYHLALNHNRMKRRETAALAALPPSDAGPAPAPGEVLDAERLGAQIERWIAELPPRRQQAFRLSRFDGLSHDEIAHVMGLSPNTVTTHIMLALQYLRDRLHAYQIDGHRA